MQIIGLLIGTALGIGGTLLVQGIVAPPKRGFLALLISSNGKARVAGESFVSREEANAFLQRVLSSEFPEFELGLALEIEDGDITKQTVTPITARDFQPQLQLGGVTLDLANRY